MSVVEPTLTAVPAHEMVLQLATERHVHGFDLSEIHRVTIGRHHGNDIQLRSRRVSNHHAEVLNEVDGLFVRDLGSTNGTYVNEESVQRHRLKSGDRIRIGTFVITVRLVPRDAGADAGDGSSPSRFSEGSVGNLLSFRGGSASASRRERSDATLPELLSALARKSATSLIRIRAQADEGRIFVVDGSVVHCELGSVRKEKALFRLLALEKGTYELDALPASDAVPRTIEGPTELLMVEGMQQVEALEKLTSKLPPMVYEIALDGSCAIPVNSLTADELEVYRCLIRHQTLVRALEESAMTDFMVLLLTHGLLQKGFFRVTRSAGGLLEETAATRPGS